MNELIDYAMPLMRIEKHAKVIHDFCLHKEYKKALDELNLLEYQAEVLRRNLICMQADEEKK